MSMRLKSKAVLLAYGVLLLFGLGWYCLSAVTPLWCDEPRNVLAAKNLAISGKPIVWDYSNGHPNKLYYARGMVITYPLAFLYKQGLSGLVWARSVPLVFVLFTLGLWIAYLRCRNRLDDRAVAFLVIFFLGQPMVFEQASFARMYAPLGFVFSILSISVWELKPAWDIRRAGALIGLMLLFLSGMYIPKMDSWQVQHVPQILLALILLNDKVWKGLIYFIRRPDWLLFALIVLLLIGPAVVTVFNGWIPYLSKTFGISMSRMYFSYWDNIGGLLRFALAANIMLLGLRWVSDQRDFFSWLFLSGLIGGLFWGLFTPPQYVYFSRYFYLPIIALTVGFFGLYLQHAFKPWVKRSVVAGYLCCSLLFTFLNFYFERGNLPVAVHWLKQNRGPHDVVIFYSHFDDFNDQEGITGRDVYRLKDANIDKVIKFVLAPGVEHVYFLMKDDYKFRNILYAKTTGRHRWSVVNRIADYLGNKTSAPEPVKGLRCCELRAFEPHQLAVDLAKLK